MNSDLDKRENEAGEMTTENPAVPRQKTAKERKREEKERIRRYREEKQMEQNSRPVRRVGTFTMGLVMVLTGIFVIYWLLHPTGNLAFLTYFAPAILIMLGGEVLYNYFFHQDARFKYDILSGIICFFLVCGCGGLAVLPVAYEYFGPERHITETRLEQEIYDVCYDAMKNRGDIASLHVMVRLEGVTYDNAMTYGDIAPSDYVDIRICMKKQYQSKEQYAAACQSVMTVVNESGVPYQYVHFDTMGEGGYSLGFYQDKFSQQLSLSELAEQVTIAE